MTNLQINADVKRATLWPQGKASINSAISLANLWNALIPRNHVRVLNLERVRAVRNLLKSLTADRVEQAIRFYASQEWQLRKGAWKTFDAFMQSAVALRWYEQAAEADERAEARARPADPRVRRLTAELADKRAAWTREERLRKQYEALPVADRRRLFTKAREQLGGELGLDAPQEHIMRKALDLMEAERCN